MTQAYTLRDRASGKWQIPLLGLSLVLLAGALLSFRSRSQASTVPEAVANLQLLVREGLFEQAIYAGDRLLQREDASDAYRALTHASLGRAWSGYARTQRLRSAAIGRQIALHYEQAAKGGVPQTGLDALQLGDAYEWQSKYESAVEQFERAVQAEIPDPYGVRKRVLALKADHLNTSPEALATELSAFLDDVPAHRLDLRIWGIERMLAALNDLGRIDDASTLLARSRADFLRSDFRNRFQYLEALALYYAGHYDEAEASLRTLRNAVDPSDEVSAMAGWLLGRVVLADQGPKRPQEALSFFSDVLRHPAPSGYAVAARVGTGEALALLERHQEAIREFEIAIDELRVPGSGGPVDRNVLRTTLSVLAEAQRQRNDLSAAVAYARLSVSLIDPADVELATLLVQQFAELNLLYAQKLSASDGGSTTAEDVLWVTPSREARAAYAAAADRYLEVAQLNAVNTSVAASSTWLASEIYARAGERDVATRLFRAYVTEHPDDPLVPRALLRLGQLHRAAGRLDEAIAAFQECYRRFPRTLDGARALVPLADCYLAIGSDQEELAEKALRVVLEEAEVFTPEAPEYADALFLLGDALNRTGDFARAIATLEETLERYPNDPRVTRTRFLLADSYRQSGLTIKSAIVDARSARDIELMRNEMLERFRTARRLYRELIAAYEVRGPATLDRLEQTYLRHARLYEADCYFETQEYRDALKRYEEIVGLYHDAPSALAAYVQIINSYTFLGQPEEARVALARALVLANSIPREAFRASVSPETRDDWKQYFRFLENSGLLADNRSG